MILSGNKNNIVSIARKKILTFEELCPEWSNLITSVGFRQATMNAGFGKKLQIADGRHCIVGEAWGFRDKDDKRNTRYNGCKECDDFGYEFYNLLHEQDFEAVKERFVSHWNSEHNKEKWC